MPARILTLTGSPDDRDLIDDAAAVLRSGGLVAFPTETVYGLGANALDAAAVARVFEAKQRPRHDPLIVHVRASWPLDLVLDPGDAATAALVERLTRLWPGPLTIVVPKAPTIPDLVSSDRPTVAVRAPAHPVADALLEAAGVPVVAPSANRFGYVSPTRAEHVLDDLADVCDVVLDGGATPLGIESTVVLVDDTRLVVLRPGALTMAVLARAVPGVEIVAAGPARDASLAPGGLDAHYAPAARTVAITPGVVAELAAAPAAWPSVGVAVLVALEPPVAAGAGWRTVALGTGGDLDDAARQLYATLRGVDRTAPDVIVVVLTGAPGLGEAIDDRLRRAAHGVVATTVDELRARLGAAQP